LCKIQGQYLITSGFKYFNIAKLNIVSEELSVTIRIGGLHPIS
jgi:hypothetical protein